MSLTARPPASRLFAAAPVRPRIRARSVARMLGVVGSLVVLFAAGGASLAAQRTTPPANPRPTSSSGAATTANTPTTAARSAPIRQVSPRTTDATRSELLAAAAAADRRGARADAAAIRQRLQDGDFRPGDHIDLTLTIDTVTHMDLVVREGPRVDIPRLASLSLAGVLRSELESTFTQYFLRYYKTPEVRVLALLRINVTGAVGHPGVVAIAPDAPVTDVISAAGGAGGGSKIDKIEVFRGNSRVLDRKAYARAVRDGITLDEAGVQSGDELRVPLDKPSRFNPMAVFSLAVGALSAFVGLIYLIRSTQN